MSRSRQLSSILPPAPTAADILRQWREDVPLCLLHSPAVDHPDRKRMILAAPRGWLVVHADQRPERVGTLPIGLDDESGDGPSLDLLRRAISAAPPVDCETPDGTWMAMLGYDLGRIIEPVAQHQIVGERAGDDRAWPLFTLAWCPDRLIIDHAAAPQVVGNPEVIAGWFDQTPPHVGDFDVEPLASSFTADEYLAAVRQVKENIAAGDIFQANLTQRFSSPFAGSTRELACRAFSHSQPRYGAYLEMPGGRCVVSMSPELFLDVNGGTREVVTRPIKGTRSAAEPDAARELRDSIKDQAELHMIVDLMRNDLGRVCAYGSVRVTESRTIEAHPTVHHGVSTIRGRLRGDVSLADLLEASFPGGSITGAPKIRAMQIIDEVEPVRRGPYCGSIGWIAPNQSARLNIAIRTIMLTGERALGNWRDLAGTLDYGAGGGIVADSDPVSEYRESNDKAAVLRLALQHAIAAATVTP